MAKPALGRGLGALLGTSTGAPKPVPASSAPPDPGTLPAGEMVQQVPLDRIHPCPFQPRKDFSEEALAELADSIRAQGIVQPLLVRRSDQGFELIAGERRWRAARLAGLREVPVVVRQADDRAVLEIALIENLQRENLNPIEEALGYAELIEKFRLTQEEAAAKVGKSRTMVTNALRLLKLAPAAQEHLRAGRLSTGHAKVLAGLATHEQQTHVAEKIVGLNLSVRQTEELVEALKRVEKPAPGTSSKSPAPRDLHVADLERRIRERLGTKVTLRYRQGKGSIEIRYFTEAELQRLLQLLGIEMS